MLKKIVCWSFLHLVFFCPAVQAEAIKSYLSKPDTWYTTAEARTTLDNMLTWQDQYGGWPKNIDTTTAAYTGDRNELHGTFDNGATISQMRILAKAAGLPDSQKYIDSFNKALDLLFTSQYPTGGWPQYYPPSKKYHRHITFNDNTMTSIMNLLYDISQTSDFAFVSDQRRQKTISCFDAGLECILKCQVIENGQLTVWCAQHDEITLEPRPARAFEPASLSGGESAGLLILLMRIENPSEKVVNAIEAGVKWYESSALKNVGLKKEGNTLICQPNPQAPVCWARFYELKTGRPIFLNRDSVVRYDFNELAPESRNTYDWYGNWGEKVKKAYQKWQKKAGKK